MDESSLSLETATTKVYYLVWLDATLESKDIKIAAQKLSRIMSHVQEFKDVQQCKQYIHAMTKKGNIVLIVSGRLGREIVPQVYNLSHVTSIYIYCMDKDGNKQWADKFQKV